MFESMEVARAVALVPIDGFVSLIVDCQAKQRISAAELSRRSGLSRSKLSRGLGSKAPLDFVAVDTLFTVLEIDPHRALLAICLLRDWRRYHDPDVEIISGLIDELPARMAAAREGGERIALPPGGIVLLAERISSVIAENDRKVVERRNSFMLEGDLRVSRRD